MMRAWEALPMEVNVLLVATDPKTGAEVARVQAHNLVTNSGRELLARMLADESGWDTGITYCALGDSATTPTVADTTLTSEQSRNAITQVLRSGSRLQFRTFFLASESNFAIEEVGLFGHSTASASADSGELWNHARLTFDNSGGSPKDITILVEVRFT